MSFSNSAHGIKRFDLTDFENPVTGDLFKYVPLTNSENINSPIQVNDAVIISKSRFVAVTYINWYQTFIINIDTLNVVRKWARAGLVTYFDFEPEKMVIGTANERLVSITIL